MPCVGPLALDSPPAAHGLGEPAEEASGLSLEPPFAETLRTNRLNILCGYGGVEWALVCLGVFGQLPLSPELTVCAVRPVSLSYVVLESLVVGYLAHGPLLYDGLGPGFDLPDLLRNLHLSSCYLLERTLRLARLDSDLLANNTFLFILVLTPALQYDTVHDLVDDGPPARRGRSRTIECRAWGRYIGPDIRNW